MSDATAPAPRGKREHRGSMRTGRHRGVPRWPAWIAVFAIGLAYALVSSQLRVGPWWLLPLTVVLVLIPATFARARGHHDVTHWLSITLTSVVTAVIAFSALVLLRRLIDHNTNAPDLLRDAGLIWLSNILVFALWYWEIDGDGPAMRRPDRYTSADFALPQVQQTTDGIVEGWSPGFVDYLFLAFNTSTAFSPTDTLILSQRAKLLMMGQSLISLIVIAVIAARAVGTL